MSQNRVLVLGAQPNSLGEAIANWTKVQAMYESRDEDWTVLTAGISGHEQEHVDVVEEPGRLRRLMEDFCPTAVVCTVGINQPRGIASVDLSKKMVESFTVNVLGPLNALRMAMGLGCVHQFVAISSNSAQIARRGSLPYCTSKAALSMALRVAAREMAGSGLLVYGYEFGLLTGTPMTADIANTFEGPLTRIPGAPAGLSPQDAARAVVSNLFNPWQGLNGATLRYDGGEQ